jgi:hypothetical protein
MSKAALYRGSVIADGVVVDTALVGEATARARLLHLCSPRSRVWRYQSCLIMRFPAPRRMIVEQAAGAPLIRRGQIWATSAVVSQATTETLILLVAGSAHTVPWAELIPEDLATWLDVTQFVVLPRCAAVQPVEETPLAPAPTMQLDPSSAFGVQRTVESDQVAAALRGIAVDAPTATASAASSPRSWWDRVRNKFAGAVWNSPAGELVAKQHAQYLERMMKMFDQGHLDEALRHAIKLGDGTSNAASRIQLGSLQPRRNLSISSQTASATSLPTSADLASQLRTKYRLAFEQLSAAGDIDRAAFVLAELLGESQEAVSFLERHQRYQLAAKLAEARGLPDGVVIRQWFIAGDRARAVAIARRTGAFADAVARLQATDNNSATALRLLWADHLAATGDFVAAVIVIWPVESAHTLAAEWIRRGIHVGGVAGATLLARAIAADALPYAELSTRIATLLADPKHHRVHFVRELHRLPASPTSRALARQTLRAVLNRPCAATQALIDDLALASGNSVLRSDLRGASPAPRELEFIALSSRPEPLTIERSADDSSPVCVYDVARLPDGNVLVALGELGIQIVTAAGRVIFRSGEPAHHIVMSDFGDRAILLAPRGKAWRLTRLSLITKNIEPWCDARFLSWATTYDGDVWWIGATDGVHAIDALRSDWAALWHARSDDVVVGPMSRQAGTISMWLAGVTNEVWTYQERNYSLLSRREVPLSEFIPCTVDSEVAYGIRRRADLPPQACIYTKFTWHVLDVPATNDTAIATAADWFAVTAVDSNGAMVSLITTSNQRLRACITVAGANRLAIHIADNRLFMCDNRGRVLVMQLNSGEVTHDIRITV